MRPSSNMAWSRVSPRAASIIHMQAVSGSGGRTVWEKLGFRVASADVEPELQKESELLDAMRREAAARGIPSDRLADRFTMRLEI